MGRPRDQQGWLTKTIDGKWKANWRIYIHIEDGIQLPKHCSRTLGKMTKQAAKAALRAIVDKEVAESGGFGDSTATFGWWWDNKYLPLRKDTWSRSWTATINSIYKCHIEPRWGAVQLAEIKGEDVAAWLGEIAAVYSKTVVQKCRIHVKSLLEEAVEDDYLRKNPMRRVKMPVTRKPARPVKKMEDFRKVRKEIEALERPRDLIAFDVLVLTGVRPSELLALKWEAFNGSALFISLAFVMGEVKDTKTEASQDWVALPEKLSKAIRTYRKTAKPELCEWMFPSQRLTPLSVDNWRKRVVQPAAARAGLKLDLRTFRRSWATLAHNAAKATLKEVQGQLRHSSVTTTGDVYVQASEDADLQRIVEAVGRKYFN